MRYIEHLVEPDKLLLSWQVPEGGMRRIVAELIRHGNDADLIYFIDTEDFNKALTSGFEGYPGYPKSQRKYENVLTSFTKRLPPRSRKDFDRFLNALRIHPQMKDTVSDFALLGYSQARLPGDDFTIIHPFDNAQPPFELLVPVQGYRYYLENVPYENMAEDLELTFKAEPDNPKDPQAIAILIDNKKVGYVCRGLLNSFHHWLDRCYDISASIGRVNGTAEKPNIFAFVVVREKNKVAILDRRP